MPQRAALGANRLPPIGLVLWPAALAAGAASAASACHTRRPTPRICRLAVLVPGGGGGAGMGCTYQTGIAHLTALHMCCYAHVRAGRLGPCCDVSRKGAASRFHIPSIDRQTAQPRALAPRCLWEGGGVSRVLHGGVTRGLQAERPSRRRRAGVFSSVRLHDPRVLLLASLTTWGYKQPKWRWSANSPPPTHTTSPDGAVRRAALSTRRGAALPQSSAFSAVCDA